MVKKMLDILLSSTFDLVIKNGDFDFGDATNQNQNLIILASKGEFKQSPTVGVGIIDYILDDANTDELEGVIQNEFEKDGLTIDKLKVNKDYTIDKIAYYKRK